jgi:methionyl-tRNA formyltransferase
MQLRVAFAGTPAFALPAFSAIAAQHSLTGVLTQPDRPAGRGRVLTASPVKQAALKQGVPVFQPARLRGDPDALHATLTRLREWKPDVMVVVAYGLILPREVLDVPRLGCLNIHASLLPRWRGAAPIQRAIEAGDAETGVAIMQMDEGLDTGAVLAEARHAIGAETTAGELHETLASLGAEELADFAEMSGVELLTIDADTNLRQFTKELRWNQAYHRLAQGF